MIEHFWMAACVGAAVFELVFIINIPRIYRTMVDTLCIGNKFEAFRREQ